MHELSIYILITFIIILSGYLNTFVLFSVYRQYKFQSYDTNRGLRLKFFAVHYVRIHMTNLLM